ncbi:hypothetical protein D3C72_1281990 [compost metagenome]
MLHQVIQRPHRFLHGCRRVEAVDLIEVDMIELQARQALLDAVDDVKARVAPGVRAGAGLAEYLGRDDHLVPCDLQVAQRLARDDFRTAFGIHVRRVDEIDPGVQGPSDQPVGVFLLEIADLAPEFAFAAEGHGAQAQLRDEQTGASEFLVSHDCTPSRAWRARWVPGVGRRCGSPPAWTQYASGARRARCSILPFFCLILWRGRQSAGASSILRIFCPFLHTWVSPCKTAASRDTLATT